MAASTDIPLSFRLKDLVVIKITGLRGLAFRLRLATYIFRFGAWVAGVGLEMEVRSKG